MRRLDGSGSRSGDDRKGARGDSAKRLETNPLSPHSEKTQALNASAIPLSQIEPLACNRPHAVHAFVAMLREGKKPPAILVIKQTGKRRRYRIFDGAHRVGAARRVGRKTIEARIIATD